MPALTVSTAIPQSAPLTNEQIIAKQLLGDTQVAFDSILRHWSDGVRKLWTHKNPQGVLDAMHAFSPIDPADMFKRSGETVAFLELQSPGCTAAVAALIKPFTVNPDDSITITK